MEKSNTDGYIILLMVYARSPLRDLENYRRVIVGIDEDAIQLILKQIISNFGFYEISPGIYTIKDNSEAVYTKGDHDGIIQTGYDDVTMKTKLF